MHDTPPARWTNSGAITAAREAAGLNMTQLAAKVGVTKVQISHVEAGRYEASVGLLGRIAAALDVDAGPFIRSGDDALTAGALAVPKPRAAA